MIKQLRLGRNKLNSAYWSLVGIASAMIFSMQPVIRARRAAEAKLHDPVILEYWDSLTEERKKEFQDYLRNTKK